MLGSIEAGGTKMNCAIGHENGTIIKQAQFPTTTPTENMQQLTDFCLENRVKSIGIGAFGPVNVNRESELYGTILDTPKLSWRFFPFLKTLKDNLNIPIELQRIVGGLVFASQIEKTPSAYAEGVKIRKEASDVQMLLFLSDKTKEVEGCTLMNVQTSLRRYTSISNLLYCTS